MACLYIEPFGGLAGDMFLAALLDLGDTRFQLPHLEALANRLLPGEARLSLQTVKRGSIKARFLEVSSPMSASPPHRQLADLLAILHSADLPPSVVERSTRVLLLLAQAEARVHGVAVDAVHFHEVGAVDTLIDVAGAALACELLDVQTAHCSPPLTGEGTVTCAHGELAVPVPAVVEILCGQPMRLGGGEGERLTPTGAALLAELCPEFGANIEFRASALGYGAGRCDPATGPPNLVRVQLGQLHEGAPTREAWQLEVHLDDATGEELGLCVMALRQAGALDVWTTPVQMKKERPGVLLACLCRASERESLAAVVFEHTPTLGLRWSRVERIECGREALELEIDGQSVRFKLRRRPDYPGASPFGERDIFPEYDDLAALAQKSGESLRALERRAVAAALAALQERADPVNES